MKKQALTAALIGLPLLLIGAAAATGGSGKSSKTSSKSAKRKLTSELAVDAWATVFPPHLHNETRRDAVRQLFDAFAKYGDGDVRKLAYILATADNENKFVSLREQKANPAKNPEIWKHQKDYWDSGYYGRGLAQLTWIDNYREWGKRKGLDLVNNPDLVMNSKVGAEILVEGMMIGAFRKDKETKKPYTLDQFIGKGEADYKGARNTVNGYLKGVAESIAGNAKKYETALLNKAQNVA